jgi:iron complex transport system substrate-binding protein
MPRRALLTLSLLCWSWAALAGTFADAAGRSVEVSEQIARVLPAGPPAAILLAALAPDLMLGWTSPVSDSNLAMRATLAQSDAWKSVRAVRDGHAFVAPSMPFGWLDEPPSINRLLGFAWLAGSDPRTAASLFNAVVYGHALSAPQLDTLLAGVHSLQP